MKNRNELIECSVCQTEIANDSYVCPECGHPSKDYDEMIQSIIKATRNISFIGIVILLWFIGSCIITCK